MIKIQRKPQAATHEGAMKSLVCVHNNQCGEPKGEIYNNHLKQPIVFTDIIGMVSKMDDLCDQTGHPQAYQQHRSFGGQRKLQELNTMDEVLTDLDDGLLKSKAGEKATFIIQVQFRQNASWQGTITWAEKKKTMRYRSTLEMLKLMDEALSEQDQNDTLWESTL